MLNNNVDFIDWVNLYADTFEMLNLWVGETMSAYDIVDMSCHAMSIMKFVE